MKTNIYTILDKVAGDHGPIFQAVNNGVARRNFRNLLQQVPETVIDDYELYRLGYFDTETGEVIVTEKTKCSVDEVENNNISEINARQIYDTI